MPVDPSLKAWLALSLMRGLGGEGARRLLSEFGSPEAVLAASVSSLKCFVKAEVASEIGKGIADEKITPALDWLEEEQNHLVTLGDSDYPQALLNIPDPPLLLYVKGHLALLNHTALAIVGSRNATPQGNNNAEEFAKTLSDAGLCIISGMAHGIDASAHRGALRGLSNTIAVVGTGLDKVYPAANRDLAHAIAGQGVMISEFPLGTPPIASNFPRRNRIISGMSIGCLVVEASLQSGSLITARLAMEQGRDVFAIPGSIHSPQSRGCHSLIKQGAKLVESARDILEELSGLMVPPATLSDMTETPDQNADLLELIGFDPVSMDTLCARGGLTVSQLSAMLLPLELEGRITALPGGLFQRNH
ncbi:MAG: DNA-protecting protein DprA [Gallionellales bacterium CG_4_10_14_3_um_filter_54_96]|nr:DNA-protecting protein DprA [Gallionella sp.]OIO74492.1 MAG: DNA protecting protein DprA [Gallionellaceae bacterium CG1_02_56_997]PIV15411.1 MAG: DNA-protecting protein DprA [Gallionellales bacterium CG03_land_8_20_14_0_80_55_15]PIV91842.1 MAG: DNA-protecting protein DprA [Gallionellales bacterium CG17_big_fil_post_rev_8_21_14_2_50_54_146]PIX05458.1 MAG: DNA-protecting protein DprA [Gallionellales bacterium CG_4_8_14_3_um_filter_54_18]PIY04996.1 MAG: DNA-protecting protein DprA [Gallionella